MSLRELVFRQPFDAFAERFLMEMKQTAWAENRARAEKDAVGTAPVFREEVRFMILRELREKGEITPTQLANAHALDVMNTARVFREMLKDGDLQVRRGVGNARIYSLAA